jgi:branched-chain amino acid transport system substrate-binding protein
MKPIRLLLPFSLIFLWVACAPVGVPEASSTPEISSEPALAEGDLSDEQLRAAGELLSRARGSAERGDWASALEASGEVVDRFPSAPGASEALRILARASLEEGRADMAEGAARQVLEVFSASDPRGAEALLILGEARLAQGDTVGALESLGAIPAEAPREVADQARAQVSDLAPGLETSELEALVRQAGSPVSPAMIPILVEYGVALYFQGDSRGGASMGQAALDAGATGREARMARALLEGDVEDLLGDAPVLGALLPSTGPPTLTRYGEELSEGIRVAIEEERNRSRRAARLVAMDDGGTVAGAARRMGELESSNAVAVIGPLLDDALTAAAQARGSGTVLLSPTARVLPGGVEGVYSLSGPDPGAGELLARYAAQAGLLEVALVYPRVPGSTFEADAFRAAFSAEGGRIVRDISYPADATSFEDVMREVEGALPSALILPLQPRDIELVAPQVTFFGLDTLGIRILGTGGWTSDAVLERVDPRHTNGVVATTTGQVGLPSPTAQAFQQRYESVLRKSLVSEIPALGYDAARLLLQAMRGGSRSPGDLRRALERIEGFQGVTGTFSFRDGLLVRRQQLARIENRTLMPVIVR